MTTTHHHGHHGHRGRPFTPVTVDPRCVNGAPVRCFARMPDNVLAYIASGTSTPPPAALYIANANPGPRNENDDDAQARPMVCLDCSTKLYDLGDALDGAALGFVMVRNGDEWRAFTWEDFHGDDDEYHEQA